MHIAQMNYKPTTLADRAVMARLKVSEYDPYAFDPHQTRKVIEETGVERAGRFNKRLLLDCKPLADCKSAHNAVYTYHIKNTVPWLDEGARLLPSKMYFDYTERMRVLMANARASARALASQWDGLVAADVARLGPMGDYRDYPEDILTQFNLTLRFLPIPQVGDFRVEISDEDRATLNGALDEAEANVTRHLITEMLKPIKAAVEKLNVPIGEEGSIFRNSLITNMVEVVQRARNLNVADDPVISHLADEVDEAISAASRRPEMLREDAVARIETKMRLDDIMSKMSGMF